MRLFLTLGAIGSILGALVANKMKSSMKIPLLFLLIMAGGRSVHNGLAFRLIFPFREIWSVNFL